MSDDESSSSSESSASEPEEKKKGRGKKKEAGPKRARSAFVFFTQDRRPTLKKANPGMSPGEIVKALSKAWADASAAEKKPFEKQAEEDKKRFIDEGGKTKKGKKPKKAGPKGPRSAFMYFSQEKRVTLKEERPSLDFADLGRAVGQAWAAASASEKAKFTKMAEKDKIRYQTEKDEQGPSEKETKKAAPKRKAKKEVSKKESSEEESGSDNE